MNEQDLELVSFGDVAVEQGGKFSKKFSLKKDEFSRIGIVFPKVGGPLIVKKSLWFTDVDGDKHNIDVSCIPEQLKTFFKIDESKQKIGCLIVKYKTERDGKLSSPVDYEILEWIFSGKKYNELMQINTEYPLNTVDLSVKCVDEKYQDYTMVPCKGSGVIAAKLQDKLIEESTPLYKSLKRSLGQSFTEIELKAMLGKNSPSGLISDTSALEDIIGSI